MIASQFPIVLDLQDLVGLNCWGAYSASAKSYWKGLEFYNTTLEEVNLPPTLGGSLGNTRMNVSSSILEYVDILYAGQDKTRISNLLRRNRVLFHPDKRLNATDDNSSALVLGKPTPKK